jgi:hypothetical protein
LKEYFANKVYLFDAILTNFYENHIFIAYAKSEDNIVRLVRSELTGNGCYTQEKIMIFKRKTLACSEQFDICHLRYNKKLLLKVHF